MRVLVIGGTGMIGSQVATRVAETGADVTVLTRGRSHRPVPDGCTQIVGDRSTLATVASRGPAFDCVIDMVCYLPEEAEVAVRALRGRTGQYILTSTVDVYRKPAAAYPCTEAEELHGISGYAKNKIRCEQIVGEAHERFGFPVTIIRPSTTYGDRYPPVHSLGRRTTYLDRLLRGRPIVVHDDGSTLWGFCHAHDVARAFAGACGNASAIGRAYNVTSEEWLTWNQMHAAVAAAIGAPPPTFVHIPTETLVRLAPEASSIVVENLRFHSIFDNARARSELGFDPVISLADGLPGWYRSLVDAGLLEDWEADPTDDAVIAAWRALVLQVDPDSWTDPYPSP